MADKAWDAIHRCLTDGTLRPKGRSILEKFVLGGKQLHRSANYIVSYVDPEEVRSVGQAADDVTKDWFRERYFGLQKKFLGFKYSDYDGEIGETDFEYSWDYFECIREFFKKAAQADRSVVFLVDQ